MMIGERISSGSKFEELAGYARAVVLPDPGGDWVLVSGTTGFDYATGEISPDAVEQTHQCFHNIEKALGEANASLDDLVRIRVILTEMADFERVAPVVGSYCRAARPANTTYVAQLVAPEMKVEIEVTARRGR